MWSLINDVETGHTPEYPDLVPQRFPTSTDAIFLTVETVARSMKRWTVVEVNGAEKMLRAIHTSALFRFKDDITIRVLREGDEAVVTMRSKSRVGKGDLGQNARTIRAFQKALSSAVG